MKQKILLIFVLFVLPLFSQVEIEDDAIYVRTSEDENKNLHCEILIDETGGWAIYFIEGNEQINIIKTDNFRYYFNAVDVRKLNDGSFISTTVSLDNNIAKKYLKDIINSQYVIITTYKSVYTFNFSKYKKELENNAFYKKIMQ